MRIHEGICFHPTPELIYGCMYVHTYISTVYGHTSHEPNVAHEVGSTTNMYVCTVFV